MKRYLLLLILFFSLKAIAQQEITINTLAVTTQPTRFEVARIYIDAANWNVSGNLEIDLKEKYFSAGLKKTYTVSYGYQVAPVFSLKDMSGIGNNNFQLSMGTEVTVTGTIKYVPIYIDLRYYAHVDVILRTNWYTTTDASNTNQGILYYNQSPTGFDIGDFNADATVNISNSAGQTILHGNVGIGTTTPGSAFTIKAANTGVSISPSGSPYFGTLAFNREAATGAVFDPTGNAFQINNGGTDANLHFQVYHGDASIVTNNALVISGVNGNVGVGTPNPQSALHVGATTSDVISVGTTDYGASTGQALAGIKAGEMPNGFGGSMEFQTLNWGQVPYALTTKMIIQGNSGNVGIGTTTPEQKLTVLMDGTTNGTGIAIKAANTTAGGSQPATAYLDPSGSKRMYSYLDVFTDTYNIANAVNNNVLTINQNGNVGIGTADNANWQLANSSYKLAVQGNIIAEQVTVKLRAAWPDYVFKPNYTLPSLTAVKTYIDKNQRLPEMPSEQEIAEKGLNLGEMNKLLVKKVEELTLYLIEQQKINQNLQQQITDLTKRIKPSN